MKHPLDLTVMMYHYVRDRGDNAEAGSGIPGMPVRMFEAQIDTLSRQHTFVTWSDVRMALQGQRPLPISACLLTFDDGICDHYINVYRILRSRNISGLFFALDRCDTDSLTLPHKIHFLLAKLGLVRFREAIWSELNVVQRELFAQAERHYRRRYPPLSTDWRINLLKAVLQRDLSHEVNPLLSNLFETHIGSEKEIAGSYYLSIEQIQEMSANGMYFGGHSRNHPWFDWIDAQAQTIEISSSAKWLRGIEAGPWAFAYPYGGMSEYSPQILRNYGFLAAFTTQAQIRHSDPFLIGRLDAEEFAQGSQDYA